MRPRPLGDIERRNWLRLSLSENVGAVTFRMLLERFGTADRALQQLRDRSVRGGLRRSLRIPSSDEADHHLARLADRGARLVGLCEPDYPPLLREIETAPPLICAKGNLGLAQRRVIGVVGARNASAAGRRMAREVARAAGLAGVSVSSGLARGIDTAAHEAALETGTIAVLAGGLDVVYPPENAALQDAIAERGLLLSEMMPGTIPRETHFPRRNRIISGLASAVVVVEAALRSGSLITARFAAEQGREVFAVPGSPLDPRCEGCNHLIRDGASLLLAPNDALTAVAGVALNWPSTAMETATDTGGAPAEEPNESDIERIAGLLSPTPVDVDDLIRAGGFDPGTVHGALLDLELAGRLRRDGRGRVFRA